MENRFNLPDNLKPLGELALNLWFSWNPDARRLFGEMDTELWRTKGKNPVAMLRHIKPERLQELSANPDFTDRLHKVYDRFQNYVNQNQTRFHKSFPHLKNEVIAYFSAEYGINEALPNYAGGLGILSGDHCKTASDLGLPFVAIGLMYKHAYFTQAIDTEGNQTEYYKALDLNELPIRLVRDENDQPLLASVPIIDHNVYFQIWEAKVGRISLYLLDTDVDQNQQEDREIIHSLYGGSRDTRIRQEIILGIGGLRALRLMGINPRVFHMNEGHSAFLGLERLFEYMNDGMNFPAALELVRATSLFTTHTPIPEGNEAFEFDMMERYFRNFWPELEMSERFFFDLGRNTNVHQHENFSLTILALNLCSMANGVSKLHGEVSRRMWQGIYPGVPTDEIPIGYVTNGIHTETWLHEDMIALFDEYLGPDWRQNIQNKTYWDRVLEIPDQVFWDTVQSIKKKTMIHLRELYRKQLSRYDGQAHGYPAAEEILSPDMLTIGFARRFAPYKRATLLFRESERLKHILNNTDRPVQIIFSGKAHPHNDAGKDLVRTINHFAKEGGYRGKIIFIEDYGIDVSKALVAGVDVWLNTPRRPLEASGTSGQKVPINGGINLSVLDGWWPEGFNGQNGWTIGHEIDYQDHALQDEIDGKSLYERLERDVVPLFYQKDADGLPSGWIAMAKESLRSLLTEFSTHTMVWNYVEKYYVPGMRRGLHYIEDENTSLYSFLRWKNRINRHWKSVRLSLKEESYRAVDYRIFSPGERKEISVLVDISSLKPEELRVELILERQDSIQKHRHMEIYPMGLIGQYEGQKYEYKALVRANTDGSYRFNCRVMPTHGDLFHPQETRQIKWLD